MKAKYDELTLTNNLSGVILPTDTYANIYSKGAYSIPLVITLYDDTINRDAKITEVHQAEGKHKSKRNENTIYKTADTACKQFIMEVFDKTWYKELEDPDKFYANVTSLKLLDHLTEFCLGLNTVEAVDIPKLTKTLLMPRL